MYSTYMQNVPFNVTLSENGRKHNNNDNKHFVFNFNGNKKLTTTVQQQGTTANTFFSHASNSLLCSK